MVGIVLVSHSRALAEAFRDLFQQVAASDVPLAIAAGGGAPTPAWGASEK